MGIWTLVVIALATVLVGILVLRLHAFLALMLAGLIVAVGTSPTDLRQHAETLVAQGDLLPGAVPAYVSATGPQRLASAFGKTAGGVGILIALASIIGACLLRSGGAAVIIQRSLAIVGERRAPIALALSAFVLGIPVFFDTVFYLMIPLARSLRRRTGRDYVLYILAIMAGGSIAHSLVPPTPGPLQVASIIGVDLLTLMVAGLVIGGLSSMFSLAAAWAINRCVDVPLRELGAPQRESADEPQEETEVPSIEPAVTNRLHSARTAPPLAMALLPIVLPIVLIALGTGSKMWLDRFEVQWDQLSVWLRGTLRTIEVVGDKNVALGIAAALALVLLRWAPAGQGRRHVVSEALASGGVIILITAAGGAFGAVLGQAGIAEAIAQWRTGVPDWMLLPMAFGITAAIRTAQGSATVAMITSAGILQGLASDPALPFHPVYLALAIGGGSKPISWMTDSGFWIMCQMSGMTEQEGLKTVTPLTIAMGLSTLFWTMLAAALVPLT